MSPSAKAAGSKPVEDSSVGPMCESAMSESPAKHPRGCALTSRTQRADRFERSLPELPVPTLQETADRYLKSLQPFHTPQDPTSPSTPLPTFAASQSAVAEFISSPLVKELQSRLEKRAAEKSSWLCVHSPASWCSDTDGLALQLGMVERGRVLWLEGPRRAG
mgnify:CR=1 FL=1